MSGWSLWTCCSTFETSSSSLSPRMVSPHGQSTFWAMGILLVAELRMLRRAGEPVERLLRRGLLGRLLRAARPDSGLLAVDHRRAAEGAVVRRALDVEHVVDDLAAPARELFLQLGLVVDVAGQRIGDPAVEGGDDRVADRLESVLEVERRQRGLEQRGEHVAVPREALQLVRRRQLLPALGEPLSETELPRNHGAACPGDDVR